MTSSTPLPATSGDLLRHLPEHLAERLPAPDGRELRIPEGPFVLYWMRVAVRGHENPALDVALHAAHALGVPLLVYHALSERYPYASYRHHAFILEGAREAHRELRSRGIAAAFHLERPGHDGPHLLTLARQARLVVTEVMPVPFVRRWTTSVARATPAPVWEVDASTLASVHQVPARVTDRAFRFRKAVERRWDRWLTEPWPEVPAEVRQGRAALPTAIPAALPFPTALPFEPVPIAEASEADLVALVASCRVDPTVAPVAHTRGGSTAGYARWAAFREHRLGRYARDRNDPLRDGVSRMSAYLHYGHVSPFRVAREAEAFRKTALAERRRSEAEGAEKYLDELLTWRELAWSWCHHVKDPESLDAIPGWARETLEAHADDPRPVLHDRETLARGRTGDPLWDAAQQSLLVHGELHNNVRMTWGKALLSWTRGPAEALDALVDLNHRYALDGRDPGSYGGLLWCLGAFDRPFEPANPVLGTVRPRDTKTHAQRLDAVRWGAATGRPFVESVPTVVIVGGGVAGLAAARVLGDHGVRVRVFDKGRGVGGRISTRVTEGWRMDHGAPFFTARDPVFRRAVRAWAEAGVVAPWTGRIGYLRKDGTLEAATETTRWVGVPGMRAVAEHLEATLGAPGPDRARGWRRDVRVRTGVEVPPLAPPEAGLDTWIGAGPWEVGGERAHAVIVTAPPPQAAALLARAHPELAERIGAIGMDPCWSVMLRVTAGARREEGSPAPLLPVDALFFDEDPVFRWIARDSSKPGRTAAPGEDHWVLHASPAWSTAHLEASADEAATRLAAAFQGFVNRVAEAMGAAEGRPFVVHEMRAHRWRFAAPAGSASAGAAPAPDPAPAPGPPLDTGGPYLWDAEAGIGVAGDALGGGRVEGAFRSGAALAGRLLLGWSLSSGADSPPR